MKFRTTDLFSERRRVFQSRMEPDSVAVFFGAEPATRTNDTHFRFRQDTDFFYLTGLEEEQTVLVLTNKESILFLRESNPEEELWAGKRTGVAAAPDLLDVDEARDIDSFEEDLTDLLKNKQNLYYFYGRSMDHDATLLGTVDEIMRRARKGDYAPARILHPSTIVHEMRLFKTPLEIEHLKECARLTHNAHVAAMQAVRPGMYEYELEALLLYEFRKGGALEGYTSIVASGANACVLHYIDNHDRIADGDLILIDAGAEKNYMTADVSRTFPASGKFTAAQRDAYQLVLDVQKQAIAETVAGAHLSGVHDSAVERLTRGLMDMKLLKGDSLEKLIEDGAYRKYYMHRTGHWLGGDVHDVGLYFKEGVPRPFVDGMVCTVEPGLYFPPEDDSVPDEFRGIGIRIEDDVLVSGKTPVVLTASIPKEIDEIEQLQAALKAS